MVQTHTFSRLATRLVAVVPLSAMFAASCGSMTDDTGDADSARLDGSAIDGSVRDGNGDADSARLDGSAIDGSVGDSNGDADSARLDGSTIDGSIRDSDGDADSARLDGSAIDGSVGDSNEEATDDRDAPDRDAPDGDAPDGDAPDGPLVDAPFVTTILGSADKFAVFSGGTVENAAATTTRITGDLGTYPGNTAVGLTPPVVVGTMHLGDAVAQTAAADIGIAYNRMLPSNLPCGTVLTDHDLGGQTLVPGVYCFASTAALTGTLTLDAQLKPSAVWVFQVGSALTTAANSAVVVINGTSAQVCNAFWQITSAATLGTNSAFGGTILAHAAITVTTGTSIVGRTFALTSKVTTDTNVISIASCPVSAPTLDGG
ncbi:MAG TPA: ice-binding family protein [Polyangiaceae bacterium]|nr:ice-binding family protein [Polyangiaceae bacterium]